jgi:hypothetical protein
MTRVQGSISMCQIGFLLEAGTRSRFPTMSSRCQPCEEKRMEACAWPASDLRFDFAARAPPDAEDDLADPDAIYARFSVSLARVSPGSFLQLVDHIKKIVTWYAHGLGPAASPGRVLARYCTTRVLLEHGCGRCTGQTRTFLEESLWRGRRIRAPC